MGKNIFRIINYIAVAILLGAASAMFAEPFWLKLYQRLGIDASGWVDPAIFLIKNSKFQVLCSIVFGFAIGAWVQRQIIFIEQRNPKKDKEICDYLLPRIDSVISSLNRIVTAPTALDKSSIAPITVVPEIKSLYNLLLAHGFEVPTIPTKLREVYIAQNILYFKGIQPSIANHQLNEARDQAKVYHHAANDRLRAILALSDSSR
jgi:hypothetical protein